MPEICNFLTFAGSRNVVLWYIGCYGLKKSCVDFYRKTLILPLLSEGYLTKFWLVDLTAWYGLKDKRGSVLKDSQVCSDIEKMDSNLVEVIRSSKTFEKIKNFSHQPFVTILRASMKLGFITNNSSPFCESGLSIKDVFGETSPLLQSFSDVDTSKCYSALQYVEGCFIVQTILENLFYNQAGSCLRDINIQFVLPNEEYRYYFDLNSTFQKDVHHMVVCICRMLGIDSVSINIEFLAFPFGDNFLKRPYNGTKGDKSLKHLDFYELTGLKGCNCE